MSELGRNKDNSILQWPVSAEPENDTVIEGYNKGFLAGRRGTVGVNLQSIKMKPLRMPGGSVSNTFRKQYLTTLEKEGKVMLPNKLKEYYIHHS